MRPGLAYSRLSGLKACRTADRPCTPPGGGGGRRVCVYVARARSVCRALGGGRRARRVAAALVGRGRARHHRALAASCCVLGEGARMGAGLSRVGGCVSPGAPGPGREAMGA